MINLNVTGVQLNGKVVIKMTKKLTTLINLTTLAINVLTLCMLVKRFKDVD